MLDGTIFVLFYQEQKRTYRGELEGGQGDGVHLDQLTVNILVDMEIFSFESGKEKFNICTAHIKYLKPTAALQLVH